MKINNKFGSSSFFFFFSLFFSFFLFFSKIKVWKYLKKNLFHLIFYFYFYFLKINLFTRTKLGVDSIVIFPLIFCACEWFFNHILSSKHESLSPTPRSRPRKLPDPLEPPAMASIAAKSATDLRYAPSLSFFFSCESPRFVISITEPHYSAPNRDRSCHHSAHSKFDSSAILFLLCFDWMCVIGEDKMRVFDAMLLWIMVRCGVELQRWGCNRNNGWFISMMKNGCDFGFYAGVRLRWWWASKRRWRYQWRCVL